MNTVVAPINIPRYEQLLRDSSYDRQLTEYLLRGFREGFRMGFEGLRNVVREAPNMKTQVGTKTELWNKIMKEVRDKHTAGPYRSKEELPLK